MRKIITALAFGLSLAATGALALDAAHQRGATGYDGDCQACHIPHKSPAAKRGFAIAPTVANQNTYGYIGAFCMQRCHLGVAGLLRADTTQTVGYQFGGGATGALPGSHGVDRTNATGTNAPAGTVLSASLPYGNGAAPSGTNKTMECTSCHDVHANVDTSNAFLENDMDTICALCHPNRSGASNGQTNWTLAQMGAANPGTHPIGANITGDVTSPGNSDMAAAFSFLYTYGIATEHDLGGHTINGTATDLSTGMTCNTCHAVHGAQNDAGGTANQTTVEMNPTEDVLAVLEVGTQGTAEPDLHANGAGQGSNVLCAACHQYNSLPGNAWNPGGTGASHPANAMSTSLDMGAIVDPSGGDWPYGSTTGIANIGVGGTTNRILCESCHAPHTLANAGQAWADNGSLPDTAGTEGYILRVGPLVLCNACHSVTPPGHHPVARALNVGGKYVDAAIDRNSNNIMDCTDCHGGGSGGAHNWSDVAGLSHMPILNSAWEPDVWNGRGNQTTPYALLNTSKECTDCHTDANTFSPSRVNVTTGRTPEYVVTGDGSHFLGATSLDFSAGLIDATTLNATTAIWPNTAAAPSGYLGAGGNTGAFSRYGGSALTAGNIEVVCESCHELEMSKNTNDYRMLVYPFAEGDTVDAGGLHRSNLCEGCHGHNPGMTGATGSHPMSDSVVTKAAEIVPPRTPTTLITAGGYANATPPTGGGHYPAVNGMNCDSCHQTHDADTQSGTFILDTTGAYVLPAVLGTLRGGSANLYGGTYGNSDLTIDRTDYGLFCTQCHAY